MGALVRSAGLTVSRGLHDANGKRAVRCLLWDAKTESLASQRLQRLQRLTNVDPCGLAGADIENTTSATSASPGGDETRLQTLQTLKTQRLHPEGGVVVRNADIADIADVFCGADSKTGAPDTTPGAANWVDELGRLEAVSRAVSDSVRAEASG